MKKINQKGFTHHLLIFGLLALVVGAAGFAGWRIYNSKKLDAQAAYNWTTLMERPIKISACKTSIGSSWKIMAYAKNLDSGSRARGYWGVDNAKSDNRILGGYVDGLKVTNVHYIVIPKSKISTITPFLGQGMGSTANSKIGGYGYSKSLQNEVANC